MIRKKIRDLCRQIALDHSLDYFEDEKDNNNDHLVSLLTKGSARLQKMSRPRISFPKLGGDTRNDQNVQLIETPRQKEMFGRVASNQQIRDFEDKKGKKLDDKSRDFNNKKISSSVKRNFNGKAFGLNVPFENRTVSAAIAGKERSRFEDGDENYKRKVQENTDVYNQQKLKYFDDMTEWINQVGKTQPGSPEWHSHIRNRPTMPKKPRQPTKAKRSTTSLSPEMVKLRGQTTESTVEHEALHHSLQQLSNKYGPHVRSELVNNMIKLHSPEAVRDMSDFIESVGYSKKSPRFNEEVLTNSRDLLVNPKKREMFKKFLDLKHKNNAILGRPIVNTTDLMNSHLRDIKRGHQKAYEYSQNVTLDDLLFKPSLKDKK